ncbi:hypothetical protein IQ782_19970 [Salipiger pacificus]|uniref:N-acetyltransferase domain-containing protein n=1 Tax=Salipiger mangrovisoli TaxID=2865933 RepID=A0ABR9X6R9_9RHOB|nr:hypothetical protein [Salipiger mangrovisoli]
MIRRALPAEAAALEAFLSQHAETSMFLRGNIAVAGLGESTHPYATTVHLWPETGPIRAAFGRTTLGYVMCQAPDAPAEVFRAYAEAIADLPVASVTGPPSSCAALIAALGFAEGLFRLDHIEPLYRLDLAAMAESPDHIRPPRPGDSELLADWFFDYGVDTGIGGTDAAARTEARARAERSVDRPALRLLIEDGTPVAMTDFNAEVADIVQIGGVFVPRALRNTARGRRVVHAQLCEARTRGIRTAVLFANNPAAARAYEAIGFEHIGGYRVAVLEHPQAAGVRA